MSWTVLRVTEAGVVLHAFHRRRLSDAVDEFDRFAERAEPGIYGMGRVDGRVVIERRGASRLVAGMPTRSMRSPVLDAMGPIPKPSPTMHYVAVREPGICTLLHDERGEFLEACSAAVVAWVDDRIALVPSDRPRVDSASEAAIRAYLPHLERPVLIEDEAPVAVVNAVAGLVCVNVPGRAPMPSVAADQVWELWNALTSRG